MPKYDKQKGASNAEGQFYEIKLAMLFLLRATVKIKRGELDSFRLASNLMRAHPFDDIVLAYTTNGSTALILLQAKHKESSTIKWDNLFKSSKDFGIKVYLEGFVGMNLEDELKGPFVSKELILYTNAPLKKDEKKLRLDKCDPNEFYRMGDKKVGKIILDDDALNSLDLSSDDVNTEKNKDFFDSFRLAYDQPNEADLEGFTRAEIASFYSILPSEAEIIYNEVYIKAQNWWKEKNAASYLTEDNNWFDTSRNNLSQPSLSYVMDLMKNKLENTGIAYKSTEELEGFIKSNKIINVVCKEKTKILSCVKVYQTLEKCFSNNYLMLLDDTSFDNVYGKVVEAFKGDCYLLAICSFRPIPNELIQIVSDKENKKIVWIGAAQTQSAISTISLEVGFNRLTHEVRYNILNIPIRLQGDLVPLIDLLNGSNCDEIITDDMLVDMMTSEVIVGRPLDGLGEVTSYHIPRMLKRKGGEEQYRSDQIRPDDGNKFVLISACPGMGKSTLISSMMGERFHWKYRIDLIRHSKLLQNQQNMEALMFLEEAIVMSDYEYKLFKVAYEHKGGIVLFFDGFDEIAPDYKDKVLQLFQSLRSSKVDEMWVTTRPGFEQELEAKLNTEAFHLEPFSYDDQKEFLKKTWKDSDDHEVEDKLRKISNATNNFGRSILIKIPEFTSVPLHLKMISKMRNEMLNSNINLWSLYERFFQIKFYEVAKQGKLKLDLSIPETKNMVDENYNIVWDKHEKLALLTMFDKYDLMQVLSIEEIKEIMKMMLTEIELGKERSGIVYGIIDDKPAFTHRTYAEFFAASWMKKFFSENPKKDFRKLRIFHLYRYEYYIVRKFFDLSMCGNSEACKAALTEDYRKLEEMAHDDLLKEDLAGRTAYHLSLAYNNRKMKRYLRKKKANVNSKDDLFKFTPSQHKTMDDIELPYSLDYHFFRVDMQLCLKYVFNEHDSGKISKNLGWVCANGDHSLLEKSIENGASVNTRYENNITPLHLAAAFGRIEVMKILIKHDALLNETDRSGFTPLNLALSFGKLEAAEFLFTKGADLNIRDNNGYTTLHWAAKMGYDCLVKSMIDRGADVNVQSNNGFTALHSAAREGHLKVVQILLSNKADPNLKTDWGDGSLSTAAEFGHSDVVGELLRHGADPNEVDRFGSMPIHDACKYGHDDVVQTLIDHKADTNFKDKDGSSPLLIAVKEGHDQIVEILLNHGADPNVQNDDNETPLYYSVENDHKEMTQLLLDNGADPNLKTGNEKWSPIHNAASGGSGEIVKMLIDRGVGINETTVGGTTLLHLAAGRGRFEQVPSLIAWGANIDPIDKNGWTPLFHAASNDHSEVLKILLDKGANIVSKSKAGLTPLQLAREKGHSDIVKILTAAGANE